MGYIVGHVSDGIIDSVGMETVISDTAGLRSERGNTVSTEIGRFTGCSKTPVWTRTSDKTDPVDCSETA